MDQLDWYPLTDCLGYSPERMEKLERRQVFEYLRHLTVLEENESEGAGCLENAYNP